MKKQVTILFFILVFLISSCSNEKNIHQNKKYFENKLYCERDSDCVIMQDVCGSFVSNKYHYNKTREEENLAKSAFIECNSLIEAIKPRCENNICIADENKIII